MKRESGYLIKTEMDEQDYTSLEQEAPKSLKHQKDEIHFSINNLGTVVSNYE